MIYVHSLGRALRFYPGRTALARDGRLLSFRELHTRVEGIAGTLTGHGQEFATAKTAAVKAARPEMGRGRSGRPAPARRTTSRLTGQLPSCHGYPG